MEVVVILKVLFFVIEFDRFLGVFILLLDLLDCIVVFILVNLGAKVLLGVIKNIEDVLVEPLTALLDFFEVDFLLLVLFLEFLFDFHIA